MSIAPQPTVTLDDRFARELPRLAVPWAAETAPDPRLLVLDEQLARHDATFTAVSRAPIDRIEDYRRRRGWQFRWVSSQPSDFSYDYQDLRLTKV